MWIAGLCLCLAVGLVAGENRTSASVLTSPHPRESVAADEACQPNRMIVYKVILHTFWSRTLFPKHYPDWRPSAQWSKLLGRSHDGFFRLFQLGQKSSAGVKAFAETGRSDILDLMGQGEGGIYDEFNAPSIPQGVGRTEAQFFVDANHTRVSLMSRIIPSPDWFIGIDSFNLCIKGKWIDSIMIEVDPIDAGTDNGFTFTAPNWATEPQGEAYRITAHYPAHPAGSFFYPDLGKLPTIGTIQFIKLKEYELSEVFHHSNDEMKYDVLKPEEIRHIKNINAFKMKQNMKKEADKRRREQEIFKEYQPLPYIKKYNINGTSLSNDWTKDNSNQLRYVTMTSSIESNHIPVIGRKDDILNGLTEYYLNPQRLEKQYRKRNRKVRKNMRKYHPPRDCRVTEWSAWSTCSKSCGIGEMSRKREVKKHSRHGGRVCPPLVETKWCGSARSCNKQYFGW